MTSFFDAVKHSSYKEIKNMLPEVSINTIDENGNNALIIALISKRPINIIKLLINNGINTEVKDASTRKSPLEIAFENRRYRNNENSRSIIKFLIEKTPHIEDSVLISALLSYQSYDTILDLIKRGVDVKVATPRMNTLIALFYSRLSEDNMYTLIKLFIARGVDINYIDNYTGENALFIAFMLGIFSIKIIKFLINHGININHRETRFNKNLLYNAFRYRAPTEVIKILIKSEITYKNAEILKDALSNRASVETIKLLIKDVDILNYDIDTLFIAFTFRNFSDNIVKLLLQKKANITVEFLDQFKRVATIQQKKNFIQLLHEVWKKKYNHNAIKLIRAIKKTEDITNPDKRYNLSKIISKNLEENRRNPNIDLLEKFLENEGSMPIFSTNEFKYSKKSSSSYGIGSLYKTKSDLTPKYSKKSSSSAYGIGSLYKTKSDSI